MENLKVVRSEKPALCPECKTPKFVFYRTPRGTMCTGCAEQPLPRVTQVDVEHPTRKMGVIFRHGKPVVCTGCQKERAVFSLASGLCLKCS